jgi:hypothetical protein
MGDGQDTAQRQIENYALSAIAKRRRSSAVTGLSTGCAGPVSIRARASLPCLADRSTEDGSSRQETREPGLDDATSMARLSW